MLTAPIDQRGCGMMVNFVQPAANEWKSGCGEIHDGRGDEGPDLRDFQVSDRYIASTIRRGIKGEMLPFARKHNAADISALLAYVGSLPPG